MLNVSWGEGEMRAQEGPNFGESANTIFITVQEYFKFADFNAQGVR